MATTLTERQNIALFDALDVPYDTSYATLDHIGTVGAQVTINEASQSLAKTIILAKVAALTTDVGTELKAALDAWYAMVFDTEVLDNGSVGDISNVTYDPDARRKRLHKYIVTIIPCYKMHEVLEKRQGTSTNISMVR